MVMINDLPEVINTSSMIQTSMISDIASEFDDESELDAMVGLEDEDALTNAESLNDEDSPGTIFENLEDEDAVRVAIEGEVPR